MSKEPIISPATQFDRYLAKEVEQIRGVWYPVKPLLLTRMLVRRTALTKLHPNPEDEFCNPAIGPNYQIVSNYEKDFREFGSGRVRSSSSYSGINASEPLEVQKIRPDGYMILNGHHRWAAAWRAGIRRVNIHIVNLTQKKDVENMLRASRHDRRVTLDLDETVFCALPGEGNGFEKSLPFVFRKISHTRIRQGIPALFQFLTRQGYDIWVYTSRYFSLEHLRLLFRYYHCPVTGLVTGTGRKAPAGADTEQSLETIIKTHYRTTVHIDNDTVLKTAADSRDFQEVPIDRSSGPWSRAVVNAFDQLGEKQ